MKKQQFMAAYEAPEVEVITLAVEQGFQGSTGEGFGSDDDDLNFD